MKAWLPRAASREGIEDGALCEAGERAAKGLIDADLGDGVVKQRIARQGQGRSGGFRVIVVYRRGERHSLSTELRRRIETVCTPGSSGHCGP